ncbi:MAG: response regulator transcription factor [Actinobacteria bacterium]|nr:response regulator transcription factor [Actinomycetota bacterium]
MTTNDCIRVLIADDHPIVREGLRFVLERRSDLDVVAEADNGREAVTLALHFLPDVALIDLDMPQLDGVGVVKELGRTLPSCRCVVLTMHDDDRHLFAAMAAGAHGYIVKGATSDDIERSIRAAAAGQVLLGAEIAARITAAAASTPPRPGRDTFPQLTERDLDILERIARGLDNTSIAHELGFAPKTIRNLVSELFSKVGAADRGDAARIARDAGLGDTCPR